jgi:glycosyltransferase involved in cell wall biosynthesis
MNTPFPKLPRFQGGLPRAERPDLLCFSHLRWNFVHQRPQHLLTAASADYRVHFVEEPEHASGEPCFRLRFTASGVRILTPLIDLEGDRTAQLRALMEGLQASLGDRPLVHWYYTPMALEFTRDLPADLCVFDCMDDLSAFRFAPASLKALEAELLQRADLVFTGGESLYRAQRGRHPDVHCFPSSVDVAHFAQARIAQADPADQADIPQPRVGFAGVIDERLDLDLVRRAAADLPEVQFVMLGPVAKIDPADLPRARNLHWLGQKAYSDLPRYMAHWQAAWMPFALNEATRSISPTKTPEYLAAGLPVVATAVPDVISSYGRQGLVRIGDADTVADAVRDSLAPQPPSWRPAVDRCLARMSWSETWAAMRSLMAARSFAPAEVSHV